jgi:hypothetical protein
VVKIPPPGGDGGHIFTAERLADGKLRIYDPQNGKIVNWINLRKNISLKYSVYILRVDELQINLDIINGIVIGNK